MTERRFGRRIDELARMFAFVEQFFDEHDVPRDLLDGTCLVVEELVTNMVRHAIGGSSEIVLALDCADDRLEMRLTDFDVEPFDIRAATDASADVPIEARRPGGLGIRLVKRLMDDVDYRYEGRTSTIALTKRLG